MSKSRKADLKPDTASPCPGKPERAARGSYGARRSRRVVARGQRDCQRFRPRHHKKLATPSATLPALALSRLLKVVTGGQNTMGDFAWAHTLATWTASFFSRSRVEPRYRGHAETPVAPVVVEGPHRNDIRFGGRARGVARVRRACARSMP
jgi:hypothetical protein